MFILCAVRAAIYGLAAFAVPCVALMILIARRIRRYDPIYILAFDSRAVGSVL